MPRPNSSIPNWLLPRHLYRHILRETTYLPPAIRATITTEISSRFHRHRGNDPHSDKHRARAANVLRKLRAANSGHKKWMEEFMMHAFARKGARRRNLMSEFLRPQPLNDSETLEAEIQQVQTDQPPVDEVVAKLAETTIKNDSPTEVNGTKKEDTEAASDTKSDRKEAAQKKTLVRRGPKPLQPTFYHKWDVQKINKLLSSQRAQQKSADMSWPKTDIKNLNPDNDIPKTNIWGKPTPERVIQARRASFWKRSIPKAMPPLHVDEWEFLGQLANGAQEEGQWKMPERRPAAKPVRDVTNKSKPKSSTLDWNWESHATYPTSRVERVNKLALFANVGPDKTDHPYHLQFDPKQLTPRWFRRAYQRVWQLSAKREEIPATGKSVYVWGSFNPGVTAPTERQLEIFEGVNNKGQKPKRRTPTTPTPEPDVAS
ncbi:hypothetical protein NW752_007104 [Fusarium irregulare]|uniref:LYR motif-containing protein Cup1-like N-terminal domain-containing protein n=1 Tax=Fusarium irregulare TaxID=2494466 RepID=A0A9W8PMI9_9HYPO|nr:hypothetical protein NW766_008003 [Fusarium irregulare]KAJ4014345.1 hypothetical protein NW752_007104 [Fusarium irregulare]